MYNGKTFESTYPAYPFPALVDFGMALSRLFVRAQDRRAGTAGPATGSDTAGAKYPR